MGGDKLEQYDSNQCLTSIHPFSLVSSHLPVLVLLVEEEDSYVLDDDDSMGQHEGSTNRGAVLPMDHIDVPMGWHSHHIVGILHIHTVGIHPIPMVLDHNLHVLSNMGPFDGILDLGDHPES